MQPPPSDAARERAVRRGPGALGFLLAHHVPPHLDRCYLCWLGRRPVWWCARCLGMYPALLLVLAIQLIVRPVVGWWDALWLFGLATPAVVDWALFRLAGRPGTNRVRTLTGVLLGFSLGRTVYLNMVAPANLLVVTHLALLVVSIAVLETIARLAYVKRRDTGCSHEARHSAS